jgi:hypothetical protein
VGAVALFATMSSVARPLDGRIDHRGTPATGIQLVEHHPGLAGHPLPIDARDTPQVTSHVQNDAGAQGLTRQPAACAPCRERQPVLAGIPHDGDDVPHVARRHHALRHNPVAAGIRAERRPMDNVRVDVAGDDLLQVDGNL